MRFLIIKLNALKGDTYTMIFFYRQNKINENTSPEKLKAMLAKQRALLEKKERKLASIKEKMDDAYDRSLKCREEILKLQSEGNMAGAAKKGSLKLDLTKKHAVIQKKYIDMNREVEYIRQRVEKIEKLLGL